MKTLRYITLILCVTVSGLFAYTSTHAFSQACDVVNKTAIQHLDVGASFSPSPTFEIGEVIVITAEVDTASKGQFVLLDQRRKPLAGPIDVPGKLNYPILFKDAQIEFSSVQKTTDGTILLNVRCLPGMPVPVEAGGNQFEAGSNALVNNLNGASLSLLNSPQDTAGVVAALPKGTLVKFTVEPLQIKNQTWYRIRLNQIEGWLRAKHSVDGKDVDTLVPFSEKAADELNVSKGAAFYSRMQYDQALSALGEAIKQEPDNAQNYVLQGLINYMRRDYRTALTSFNSAIALEKDSSVLYNLRGIVNLSIRNYPVAIADFNRAVQLNSAFTSAYNYRAYAYMRLNQFDEAAKDIAHVLDIDPLFARSHYFASDLAYKRKDHSTATQEINQAIKLEPMRSEYYEWRGWLYFNADNAPLAIANYQQALKLNPNSGGAHYELGLVYYSLDKLDAALEQFSKAAQIKDSETGCRVCSYLYMGQIYFAQGDYDKALDSYTHAIEIDPYYAEAYKYRSQTYAVKGNMEAAQKDAQKADELEQSGQASTY